MTWVDLAARKQRRLRRKLKRGRYGRLNPDARRMHRWDEMLPGRELRIRTPAYRRRRWTDEEAA